MLETHPFGDFIPAQSKYLLIGSFPAKTAGEYEWFYSSRRNQFWPILEEIYGLKLNTTVSRQNLVNRLQLALTDIILSCERIDDSNLDTKLTNLTLNIKGIEKILLENDIQKVFFTSRFVESLFVKHFKGVVGEKLDLHYLPSPSPRYAGMSRAQKVEAYRKLLPKRGSPFFGLNWQGKR